MLEKESNRRSYLKKGFLAAGAALFYAACKSAAKKENSGSPAPTAPQGPSEPQAPTEVSDPTQNNTAPATPVNCTQASIDLKTVPKASENLTTEIYCYGDSSSTLLIVHLPKYQYGNLISMTVMLQPSGRIIAQKGIFDESNIRPDTTLRPVAFDGLRIRTDTQAVVLFKMRANQRGQC